MNINTIKVSALAALVATVLTVPSAMATGFTLANGDLFVGFRQTGNNTSDYLINLTKINSAWSTFNLRDATGPVTLTIANIGTDFTTAFGSATPTGVTFGLAGYNGTGTANGDPFRTYYLSEPTGSTTPQSNGNHSATINAIGGVAGTYGPLTTGAVANGTILTDSTNGLSSYQNSWSTRVLSAFGNSQLSPIETSLGTTLDLFKLPQGTNQANVINEGTVSFNVATSTFTFTPVPEPSTILFGITMLGALGCSRRRQAVAA